MPWPNLEELHLFVTALDEYSYARNNLITNTFFELLQF